jgi:hypothetical protein
MPEWITALCDSAALLLLASGGAKLRRPGETAAALVALTRPPAPRDRVPTRRWPAARLHSDGRAVARAAGLAELSVAALVLAAGGRLAAALLAATYLGFLVVAARLRAVAAGTSCGCFGAASAPVGRAHLVVCGAAALVAGVACAAPLAPAGDLVRTAPAAGTVLLALSVLLAALTYLSLTALPALGAGAAPRGAPS